MLVSTANDRSSAGQAAHAEVGAKHLIASELSDPGFLGDINNIAHDASDLVILGRVDAAHAHLFQGQHVLWRNDATNHKRHVF